MLRKLKNTFPVIIALLFSFIVLCSCKENGPSDEEVFNEKYKVEDELITFWGYCQPTDRLTVLMNNPYLSDEDREKIEFAQKVAEEYPLIVDVDFRVHENSYEDPNIVLEIELFLNLADADSYDMFRYSCVPDEIRDKYYLKDGNDICTEIRNRIGVMWLNGEIDDLYSIQDFDECFYLIYNEIITDSSPNIAASSKCCIVSKESKDKFESVTRDLDWFRKVCAFSYESNVPSDSLSSDNYRIFSLIYDYYMSHNPKLTESVGVYEYDQYLAKDDDATYDFFRLYKEYGDDIFDPERYDEIFADYDKQIMDYFGINVDQMR